MISKIDGEMRRRDPKIIDEISEIIIEFDDEFIFFDLSNRVVILTIFLRVFKKVCVLKYIYSYF